MAKCSLVHYPHPYSIPAGRGLHSVECPFLVVIIIMIMSILIMNYSETCICNICAYLITLIYDPYGPPSHSAFKTTDCQQSYMYFWPKRFNTPLALHNALYEQSLTQRISRHSYGLNLVYHAWTLSPVGARVHMCRIL